ncbi:PaaI family thioesterase [Gemmatimonadota bacterium]
MSNQPDIRQSFANVPVHRFLGLRMISPSSEQATVEMDLSPDLCQETGVVHGGILSALADATAANLFQPYVPDHLLTTSIEFKMNFLRPVLAEQGKLVAKASVLRHGWKRSPAFRLRQWLDASHCFKESVVGLYRSKGERCPR